LWVIGAVIGLGLGVGVSITTDTARAEAGLLIGLLAAGSSVSI
jgi:hypothetical protein